MSNNCGPGCECKGGTATVEIADPDRYIALGYAILCVDCDNVYVLPRNICPACGSHAGLPLSKILVAKRNKELVEGLRALSKLLQWVKQPPVRKEKPCVSPV